MNNDGQVCVPGHFSRVQLSVTPWTVACRAPLSMGFSRQEYWSGLPFPPRGDLSNPGTEHVSLTLICLTCMPISCIGMQVLYH